jgi:hypothetical protein
MSLVLLSVLQHVTFFTDKLRTTVQYGIFLQSGFWIPKKNEQNEVLKFSTYMNQSLNQSTHNKTNKVIHYIHPQNQPIFK